MRDDVTREDLALQASQSHKTGGERPAEQRIPLADIEAAALAVKPDTPHLPENTAALNAYKVAQAGAALPPPAGNGPVTTVQPNAAGVVILPAGAKIAVIQASGTDLRIVLEDGSVFIVAGGVANPPSIQIGTEVLPGASLTAVFGPFQEVQPAAGEALPPAGSLGFTTASTTMDQAFQFSELLDRGAIDFSSRGSGNEIGGGGGGGSGGSATDDTSAGEMPTAENVSVSGDEDSMLTAALGGTDSDGTIVGYVVKTLPASGTLWLNADGTGAIAQGQFVAGPVYFQPNADWNGGTTFEYTAIDDNGNESANATVTLTVDPVNDAPTAENVSASGDEDTILTVTFDGADGDGTVAGYIVKSLPTNGTLWLNADGTGAVALNQQVTGTIYFQPNADWGGGSSFDYTAIDNEGAESASATVSLTVDPVNDAPTAENVSVSGDEDTILTITFDGADIDGTVVGFIVKSLPANGTLWLNANGTGAIALNQQVSATIYFEPNADWNGNSSFDYAAIDNQGAESANATVSLTVDPVNDAPTAENVSASGDEDTILTVTFDGADIDGTVAGYIIKSLPANGTLWLNADGTGAVALNQQVTGTLYFKPNANWNGGGTFHYAAIDNEGAESANATVSLSVAPVNDAPTAIIVHTWLLEDSVATVIFLGDDIDGTVAGYVIKSLPANGTLWLNSDATGAVALNQQVSSPIYFQPDADWNGDTSFAFAVVDNQGAESISYPATFHIAPVNDAPTAVNVSASGNEETILTVTFDGADIDGTVEGYIVKSLPANGTLWLNANGTGAVAQGQQVGSPIYFQPNAQWNGNSSFEYAAIDNEGAESTTATVSLNVASFNDAPTAENVSASGNEDAILTVTFDGADSDGTVAGYIVKWLPLNGTLWLNADGTGAVALNQQVPGTIYFQPDADWNGSTSFDYVAIDNEGAESALAIVSLNVAPVNDAPAAENVSASGNEDTTVAITFDGADIDGTVAGYIVKSLPANGTLWLNSNNTGAIVLGQQVPGTIYFQPATNWNGATAFDYAAIDNDGAESAIATVTMNVAPVNDQPFITSGSQTGLISEVADNAAGENVTVHTRSGTVTFTDADAGDTHITYAQPFSFNYTSGAVSFTPQQIATLQAGFSIGALDQNNKSVGWTYTISDAAIDFLGTATANMSFRVFIEDNNGSLTWQTVNISISGANDIPVITSDDTFSVSENTTTVGTVTSFDPDIGALRQFSIAGGADAGRFNINSSTGALTFKVAPDFENPTDANGDNVYQVRVQVWDTIGITTGVQDISVTVTNVNETPAAQNGSFDVSEDSALSGSVLATDPDSNPLTYSLVDPVDGLTFNSDGTFTFTPGAAFQSLNDGESAAVTFQYRANDGALDSNVATVTITVQGVDENGAPTAENVIATGNEDTLITVTLDGGDIDGNLEGFIIKSLPVNGTLYRDSGETQALAIGDQIDAGENVYFRPAANFSGEVEFEYTAVDAQGAESAQATATIDVSPVADAPSYQLVGTAGGKLYFTAYTAASGMELWSFDGTTSQLVADINPGAADSFAGLASGFIEFNGKLYFSANGFVASTPHTSALWSFDGATAEMAASISNNSQIGHAAGFTEYDGKLYFSANGTGGREFWSFDGTTAERVADINPGNPSSAAGYLGGFTEYDGKLYFGATNGTNGFELWSYDGVTTQMAVDIRSGSASSSAGETGLIEYDGKLYFSAFDGSNGTELWSYDGTTAEMVANINPGSGSSNPGPVSEWTVFKGKLYFTATDGTSGYELWSFDGTDAERVADINAGLGSSNAGAQSGFTEFNGKLYFSASNFTNGFELWSFDGTNPPSMVADIRSGSASSNAGYYGGFSVFNGKLYFSAETAANGYELWSYDGVNAPQLASDIVPGAGSSYAAQGGADGRKNALTVFGNDELAVFGNEGASITLPAINAALTDTDGSETLVIALSGFPAGATFSVGALDLGSGKWLITSAAQIAALGTTPLVMNPPANWNGNFTLTVEAIVTDSATLSTGAVTDTHTETATVEVTINSGNAAPTAENVTASGDEDALITVTLDGGDADGNLEGFIIKSLPANGTLYRDSGETQALAIGDQVDAGDSVYFRPAANFSGEVEFNYAAVDAEGAESAQATATVDVSPIADAPTLQFVANFGEKLYFQANHPDYGSELWSFDGTTSQLAADISSGIFHSNAGGSGFAAFNGKLYFAASDGISGTELWSYDGVTAKLEADIASGGSFPRSFIEYNGKLYFNADDSVAGSELWSFDGTTAQLEADLLPGGAASGAGATGFAVYDGKLYFSAINAASQYELWSYDGAVAELVAGSQSFFSTNKFTVFDGKLYFIANIGGSGNELWSFDGSTLQLAADIHPDPLIAGNGAGGLTEYEGKLYFVANEGVNGLELWSFDGVNAELVADINPGAGDSTAGFSGLTVFNGKLYFAASDGTTGRELWSYDGTNAALVADINPGSANSDARAFTVFGGKLYFSATDGANGLELWSYDGINPPQLASDIRPGSSGSNAGREGMIVFNAEVVTGEEDMAVTLPAINAALADTDGSETLVFALSGYPAGATFSVGAFDVGSGKWLITDPAEIADLDTTQLTMTPPANWNGTFTLTVEAIVTDSATLSTGVVTDTHTETATVEVTINAVNDLPTAQNVSVSGDEDTILTVTFDGADSDGTVAGYIVKSLPTDGTLWLNANGTGAVALNQQVSGTIYFEPNANFSGEVEFNYTAIDAEGAESAQATATIDVAPVADVPSLAVLENAPLTGESLVNTTVTGSQQSAVVAALPGGNYVVAWADEASLTIRMQRMAPDGTKIGAETALTSPIDGSFSQPSIQPLAGGHVVMVWQASSGSVVSGAVVDANGVQIASFSEGAGIDPKLSVLPGGQGFAVSYASGTDVYVQRYFADGTENGSRIQIAAGGTVDTPDIAALPDGGYVVTYTNLSLAPDNIVVTILNGDGSVRVPSFSPDPGSTLNQILAQATVLASGNILISWDMGELQTQLFAPDGKALSPIRELSGFFAEVTNVKALPDGGYLVVYTSVNANPDVFARRYDESGNQIGDAFRVNETSAGTQHVIPFVSGELPVALLEDGSLVVVWSSNHAGQGMDIYSRVFNIGIGVEDVPLTLPGIVAAVTDTDGSETLVLALSGFPAGATFSVGALDAGSGKWLITNAAEIAALDTTPLVMTPPLSWNGTFTLTVEATVTDTSGAQTDMHVETRTKQITIGAVNELPVANAVSVSGNEDTTLTVNLSGSDNDGVIEGFIIKSLPTDGTLWLNANGTGAVAINQQVSGTLYFQPNANFSGEVEFEYAAIDAQGAESAQATVTLDVAPVADAAVLQVIGAGAGKLFFNATTDAHGGELWSFDGTTAQRVTDIRAGADPSNAGQNAIYEYNGKIYFSARDAVNNYELWSYDGTNVTLEADIAAGSGASSHAGNFGFIEYDGKLFFGANGGTGIELWSFDGTTAQLEAEINTGAGNGSSNPDQGGFAVYNGKLYFSAQNDTIGGHEFWSFDGTTATMVAEIYPGIDGSTPRNFKEFNGKLYFSATDGASANGTELWSFDGTTVQLAANINAGPASSFAGLDSGFTEYNGKLYFSAQSGTSGFELWSFDGTTAVMAADIRAGTNNSSFAGTVGGFTEFKGKLYFTASSGPVNYELWSFDGTAAQLVADINAGSLPSYAGQAGFAIYDGKLYFAAAADGMNSELWSYDGINPPQLAADINGTSISSNAGQGPMVVFGAGGPIGGDEDTEITLPVINASLTDTDGSETLTIALSGYPAGATFSVGAFDAGSGKWLITDPAEIASLGTTQMTMTPPANWNGTFTLTVEAITTDTATLSTGAVTDTHTETATVDVTINPVAESVAPTAENVSASGNEDTLITVTLDGDDADGDLAGFIVKSLPANGTLWLNSNGTGAVALNQQVPSPIYFQPNADWNGDTSFTYTAIDASNAESPVATVNIEVAAVNDAPVITSSDSFTVPENTQVVGFVTTSDVDGGARTYSISGADAARFTIGSSTGTLTFVAAPNFESPTDAGANNVYNITVQASDGFGGVTTQAVAITVTNVNEAPVFTSPNSYSLVENSTAVGVVAATDQDAGAVLTYSIFGGADAARFSIHPATGALSFVAAPDFESPTDAGANNVYNVTVRVSDGIGGITTQDVAITVTNGNDAPVITSPNAFSVAENTTAVGTVTSTDPEGNARTYSISGGADAAQFAINPTTGALAFVSGRNFESPIDAGGNNVYNVEVQASDGLGGIATQAVSVTVTNVNEAPSVGGEIRGTPRNMILEINFSATDPEGGPFQFVIKSLPSSGTLHLVSNGSDAALTAGTVVNNPVYFKPALNFLGDVSFTYSAIDPLGLESNTGNFTVSVQPSGEEAAPVATAVVATGNEDATITVTLQGSDADGDLDGFIVKSLPTNGTLWLNANGTGAVAINQQVTGTLFFQPNAEWSGSTSFTFTAIDALDQQSPVATAAIDVAPVADAGSLQIEEPSLGELVFGATVSGHGNSLATFDGTTAEVVPGGSGISPSRFSYSLFEEFNGKLYFFATTAAAGQELWSYDGVTATLAADILLGNGSSLAGGESGWPSGFTEFDGKLYFVANDGVNGAELWNYDGTNAALAADINVGSGSSYAGVGHSAVYNGKLYFSADDGMNGSELWSYDGSNAELVAEIHQGPSGSSPKKFTVFGGKLYFWAEEDAVNGYELWSYDGTTAQLAANIGPQPFGASWGGWTAIAEYDGKLFFGAYYPGGQGLWSFDGTTATLESDVSVNVSSPPIVFQGKLYFAGSGVTGGYELWSFDGTNAEMVADINPSGPSHAGRGGFAIHDGKLYFGADDGINGMELWSYDGINPPTLAANLPSSSSGSSAAQHNLITFGADAPIGGDEDTPITLPPITASLGADTDGSETLTIALSGYPAGATFSVGAFDVGSGKWLITNAAQIAALDTTQLVMTPPASWNGTFTLTVEAITTDTATLSTGVVTDTHTETATVEVTINAVNDAPTAGNVTATGNEDTTITVTFNGSDSDGTVAGYIIKSLPANGTLWLNADGTGAIAANQQVTGTVYFKPNANWNGNSAFNYAVLDSENAESALATVSLVVNPVNDPTIFVVSPANIDVVEGTLPFTIGFLPPTDVDGPPVMRFQGSWPIVQWLTFADGTPLPTSSGLHTVTVEEFLGWKFAPGSVTGDFATTLPFSVFEGGSNYNNSMTFTVRNVDGGWYQTPQGTGFSDYLIAGDRDDNISGGNGNDVIYVGGGNDTVNAGAGDDTIYGGTGNDQLYGNDGNDYIEGGEGDDIMYGNAGNDTLVGGAGVDTLRGFGGVDTFIMTDLSAADVIVDYSGADGDGDLIDLSSLFQNDNPLANGIVSYVGNELRVDLDGAGPDAYAVAATFTSTVAAGPPATISILYTDTSNQQQTMVI